jgi:hypothetical protein
VAGYLLNALVAAGLATTGVSNGKSTRSADALPPIKVGDSVSAAAKSAVKAGQPGAAGAVLPVLLDAVPGRGIATALRNVSNG